MTEPLPLTVETSISPAESQKRLAVHAKNIRRYYNGVRKGAAELYGYAYLCGREMVAAKGTLLHGNKDPEGGLIKWLAQEFPEITDRTARNWMAFAKSVDDKRTELANGKAPLQLTTGTKLTAKNRGAILELVPQLMDGKTMTAFMRDSKLARDPEHQTHTPPKELTPEELNAGENQRVNAVVGIAAAHLKTFCDLSEVDLCRITPQARLDFETALANARQIMARLPKTKTKSPAKEEVVNV